MNVRSKNNNIVLACGLLYDTYEELDGVAPYIKTRHNSTIMTIEEGGRPVGRAGNPLGFSSGSYNYAVKRLAHRISLNELMAIIVDDPKLTESILSQSPIDKNIHSLSNEQYMRLLMDKIMYDESLLYTITSSVILNNIDKAWKQILPNVDTDEIINYVYSLRITDHTIQRITSADTPHQLIFTFGAVFGIASHIFDEKHINMLKLKGERNFKTTSTIFPYVRMVHTDTPTHTHLGQDGAGTYISHDTFYSKQGQSQP